MKHNRVKKTEDKMSIEFLNYSPRKGVKDFTKRWLNLLSSSIPMQNKIKAVIMKKETGFQFYILVQTKSDQFITDLFVPMILCEGQGRFWQKKVFEDILMEFSEKLPFAQKLKPLDQNKSEIYIKSSRTNRRIKSL